MTIDRGGERERAYRCHLLRELPRGSFHTELFARSQTKYEAKVNVDQMTSAVNHDIAVMSAERQREREKYRQI
jgi:hypothetical protein